MNILVFSEAAWDNKNSFGNTVSNFFEGTCWKQDFFSNFYCRNQMPDNSCKVNYYNLSAIDIVKSAIKGRIKGKQFSSSEVIVQKEFLDKAHTSEQKNIDKIHNGSHHFVYFVHELIWMSKIWMNKDFKRFVDINKPDVLFAFATSSFILWPLVQYLKKKTNCKVVLLVADDEYGRIEKLPFLRRCYLKPLLIECILRADLLYGISDEMSELYRERFNKSVSTLYKGCDLSLAPKEYLNTPIRMVYAGNLLWGRADILGELAKILDKINQDGQIAQLEIYTGTTITTELSAKLNKSQSSKIMGSRPYSEIKDIMHDADIVLHVESFDPKQEELVKYSFSTKIIDCLQSGNVILGIGPKDIASIKYLKKIDGALVIDDQSAIHSTIEKLLKDLEQLPLLAARSNRYAHEYHEIHNVQNKFRNELQELIER